MMGQCLIKCGQVLRQLKAFSQIINYLSKCNNITIFRV
jgi:hypothetical protein